MKLVFDSSAIVAAVSDPEHDGLWSRELIGSNEVTAPHIMPAEVMNILRRGLLSGSLSSDTVDLALESLLTLRVDLYSLELLAPRVWELRHTVTTYDAWYVALAEWLDAPLATLDLRLTRATGPRCRFVTP